jgi:EmrB/QacA subfamily drug resistance transporter
VSIDSPAVTGTPDDTAASGPDPRRWLALMLIAVAQLMVVLDATITNIALPHAQSDLGISDANRQWILTAYTLAFGGLLLFGGRIADYWGRKRTFLLGVIGFALASALGGLAQNAAMLFSARALQGVFGALLAPAALALLTVTFTEAKERARAFAVFGGIAAGGAAVGLVLGGVLTDFANWRWCLLVNIPVAAAAAAGAIPILRESRAHGDTRYDVPGAVAVTAGLVALVYGCVRASQVGWSAPSTLAFLAAGVLLLVLFVVIEVRSPHPTLPMRIPLHAVRGGALLTSLMLGAGFIGCTLFLTFYFQQVLLYSPLKAGVVSLPTTLGVLISAIAASQLMLRTGPRWLMTAGCVVAAAGLLMFTRIGLVSGFWPLIFPAELILGIGLGLVFVPLSNAALVGVDPHDAGAASALVNATQQVGGSLGTAALNTVAVTASAGYAATHLPAAPTKAALDLLKAQASVHGFSVGFGWGAAVVLAGGVVAAFLVGAPRPGTGAAPVPAVHL